MGILGRIKQFFKAESRLIWNKNDMKPFWTQFGLYAKKVLIYRENSVAILLIYSISFSLHFHSAGNAFSKLKGNVDGKA